MGVMKPLFFISLVIAVSQSSPVAESYAEGYGYHPQYENYYVSPLVAAALPPPQASQHHAQDELGQYEYGYNTGNTAKHELKTADGITRGSYSYVDANGILQTTNYVSDDVFGFRVAATNLPQHVIGAPAASEAHIRVAEIKTEVEPSAPVAVVAAPDPQVVAPTVAYSYLPYALQYGYNARVPVVVGNQATFSAPIAQVPVHVATPNVVVAPAAAPVPAGQTVVLTHSVPTTHQFHAQDELGQYQFGYTEPTASRIETKTADGVVTGQYNYVDSNGIIQTVHYIADDLGFRVAGTNLPQHLVPAPVAPAVAPLPVAELPEVVAAREEHNRLVQEALILIAAKEIAQPNLVAIPDNVDENVNLIINEDSDKTESLQPYVPPPTPQFYKPANPEKVAAAIEQAWGTTVPEGSGSVESYNIAPAPASIPLGHLSYTVGNTPAIVAPVVSQPQVYVAQAPQFVAAPAAVPQPQVYVAQAPQFVAAPPAVTQGVVVAQPATSPVVVSPAFVPPYIAANQHHAQDEYGQYQYGYSNEDSSKLEQRLADGSVRGTYSYVDANNVVQRVDYISDALGFRVAATNLPAANAPAPAVGPVVALPDGPIVKTGPAEKVVSGFVVPTVYGLTNAEPNVLINSHDQFIATDIVTPQQPVEPIITDAVPLAVTPNVVPTPYFAPSTYVPVTHNTQPLTYASQYGYQYVPSPITASQYHAQTEFGEYNYGYNNVNSAKSEIKTVDGAVRGSYSYVDANNVLQRVDYIADDVFGFRVAATNLPVAPAAGPAPLPVPAPAAVPYLEIASPAVFEE